MNWLPAERFRFQNVLNAAQTEVATTGTTFVLSPGGGGGGGEVSFLVILGPENTTKDLHLTVQTKVGAGAFAPYTGRVAWTGGGPVGQAAVQGYVPLDGVNASVSPAAGVLKVPGATAGSYSMRVLDIDPTVTEVRLNAAMAAAGTGTKAVTVLAAQAR